MRIIETETPKSRDYSNWFFKDIEHDGISYNALSFFISFSYDGNKVSYQTYKAYRDNTLDEVNNIRLIEAITKKNVYELFLYMVTGKPDSKDIKESEINTNVSYHRSMSVNFSGHLSYELSNVDVYFYEFYNNMCLFYAKSYNKFYILTKPNKVLTNRDKEKFKILNLRKSDVVLFKNKTEFRLYEIKTNICIGDIISNNDELKNKVSKLKDKLTKDNYICTDSSDVLFNGNDIFDLEMLNTTYNKLLNLFSNEFDIDKEIKVNVELETLFTNLNSFTDLNTIMVNKTFNDFKTTLNDFSTFREMFDNTSTSKNLVDDIIRIFGTDSSLYQYVKVTDKSTGDLLIIPFISNEYKTHLKVYYELVKTMSYCLRIKSPEKFNKHFTDAKRSYLSDLENKKIDFDICKIKNIDINRVNLLSEDLSDQPEKYWLSAINNRNVYHYNVIYEYSLYGYTFIDFDKLITKEIAKFRKHRIDTDVFLFHSFLALKDFLESKTLNTRRIDV